MNLKAFIKGISPAKTFLRRAFQDYRSGLFTIRAYSKGRESYARGQDDKLFMKAIDP